MNKLRKYLPVILIVSVAVALVVFVFWDKIPHKKLAVSFNQSYAREESYQFSAPDRPLTQDSKNKLEEISGLNGQVLTLVEKSQTASLSQKSQNVATEKTILKQRAAKIESLAVQSPDAAFAAMLPPKSIEQIPAEAKNDVEKPVTLKNVELKVVHFDHFNKDDLSKSTDETKTYFTNNGHEKQLYLTGDPSFRSGTKISLMGYQLPSGNVLASSGGISIKVESAPPPESVGEQETLVILVNFLDSGPAPFTKEQAKELVFNGPMQSFYKETSYAQTWFTGDVVGWYTLPRAGSVSGGPQWPQLSNTDGVQDDLRPFLMKDGIDLSKYSRIVIMADHPNMSGGWSYVGKAPFTYQGKDFRASLSMIGSLSSYKQVMGILKQWSLLDFVLSHELGHALGVVHANSWNCEDKIMYGANCQHIEYGNFYDVMGAGGGPSLHFNAYFKDALGWLTSGIKRVGDTHGQYQSFFLSPLESSSGDRGISITPPGFDKPSYYLEYRTATGFDVGLSDQNYSPNTRGVMVNWIPEKEQWAPMSRLLDMTPSVGWSWNEVALMPESQYTDLGRGVSIMVARPTRSSGNRGSVPGINVMVKTFTPICQTVPPSITYYVNKSPVPGDTVLAPISIRNIDSPSCGKTSFRVEITPPTGWTSDIYPEGNFDLEPGDSRLETIQISVPSNAQGGQYEIEVKILKLANDGSTVLGTTSRILNIWVNGPTPTTGELRGMVLRDDNGNGVQDAGEVYIRDPSNPGCTNSSYPLAGVTINYSGQATGSAALNKCNTSGDPIFSVPKLPAGAYTVSISAPAGWAGWKVIGANNVSVKVPAGSYVVQSFAIQQNANKLRLPLRP